MLVVLEYLDDKIWYLYFHVDFSVKFRLIKGLGEYNNLRWNLVGFGVIIGLIYWTTIERFYGFTRINPTALMIAHTVISDFRND